MILETLVQFCCNLLVGMFSLFEVVSLPLDLINVLFTFISAGVSLVGADILGVFAGSVMLWWSINISIGVGVWVYNKIPFV